MIFPVTPTKKSPMQREESYIGFNHPKKKGGSFAHQTQSSAVRRSGGGGRFNKMFLWTGSRAAQGNQCERSTVYQKIREHGYLDKRKTVTALKAGEDRAIFLGLTMIMCSMMLYFILGITILRSYMESVWTEESWCTVLNSSNIGDMTCTFSCGSDCYGVSKYPCLQVFVILNSSGEVYRLSHTEETLEINPECFYVPKCKKTCNMTVIESIAEHFKKHQQFPCFHDRERKQENVLLTRQWQLKSSLFISLFWPTCMLIGGTLIITMVKLTQYLSFLCEGISKIKR
ncbi:calcium-activated potassium channel subunit beta-2-like isoform X1 [Huso huso]|uniref:Calcium-activated potassium channel subunit beta-2-like isoform X1 n=1 Tax=Huso huso TaxID=61971 RepID=A0ABR0ZGV0_HUSHU